MSKIAKEKGFGKWMKGKKLSEKTKEKIKNSIISKLKDFEMYKKISHKGKKYNVVRSEEYRNKISKLHKNKKKSENHKKKISMTLKRKYLTGEIIHHTKKGKR